MATSGHLKIKVFKKKDYDVKRSVQDVTNKIVSRDSNYNVNVVMWPKFGNSSISVREVSITSILNMNLNPLWIGLKRELLKKLI